MPCAIRAAYTPDGAFNTIALSNVSRSDSAPTNIGDITMNTTREAAIREPYNILLLPAIGFCNASQSVFVSIVY